MVHDLLPLLPRELPPLAVGGAVGAALLGAGLWLAGSRFSQGVIALLAVAAGALVGRSAPAWIGIELSAWTTIIGGALVLGILGYIYHRGWVVGLMGLLCAAWAILGTWAACGGASGWSWPTPADDVLAWDYLISIWDALPQAVQKIAPFSAGASLITGVGIATCFKRLGTMLFYSMLGLSLAVACGSLAVLHYRPEYFSLLTTDARLQIGGLAALVLLGVLMQWWLSPRSAGNRSASPAPKADDND